MVVRLQKNKARLKSDVTNLEDLLQMMVTDDLISREEKEVKKKAHLISDSVITMASQ